MDSDRLLSYVLIVLTIAIKTRLYSLTGGSDLEEVSFAALGASRSVFDAASQSAVRSLSHQLQLLY